MVCDPATSWDSRWTFCLPLIIQAKALANPLWHFLFRDWADSRLAPFGPHNRNSSTLLWTSSRAWSPSYPSRWDHVSRDRTYSLGFLGRPLALPAVLHLRYRHSLVDLPKFEKAPRSLSRMICRPGCQSLWVPRTSNSDLSLSSACFGPWSGRDYRMFLWVSGLFSLHDSALFGVAFRFRRESHLWIWLGSCLIGTTGHTSSFARPCFQSFSWRIREWRRRCFCLHIASCKERKVEVCFQTLCYFCWKTHAETVSSHSKESWTYREKLWTSLDWRRTAFLGISIFSTSKCGPFRRASCVRHRF